MKIGILALQGDFDAHHRCLKVLAVHTQLVRSPSDLEDLDGLILPGGESTTISRLLVRFQLFEPLRQKIAQGLPTFATCAGLILLSQKASPPVPALLQLLPVEVQRNGYGPQTESSLTSLSVPFLQEPLSVHFIRAPLLQKWDSGVQILATYQGSPVLIQYGNILAATFHPELDPHTPFYSYWLKGLKSLSFLPLV
jgi:5'-phosphate synthase pdxT subunit